MFTFIGCDCLWNYCLDMRSYVWKLNEWFGAGGFEGFLNVIRDLSWFVYGSSDLRHEAGCFFNRCPLVNDLFD